MTHPILQHVQHQLIILANELTSKHCTVYTAPNTYSDTLSLLVITKGNKHIGICYNLYHDTADNFSVFKYLPRTIALPDGDRPSETFIRLYTDQLDLTADELIGLMVDTPACCDDFNWLSKFIPDNVTSNNEI